jgi:hypothetical protein
MGFLKMNWLRKLWGVQPVSTKVAPPIDCADCRDARGRGLDACEVHHNAHLRPHTYEVGHQVSWGSPLSMNNDQMPLRDSESIH